MSLNEKRKRQQLASRKWQLKNPDKVKAYSKKWHQQNKNYKSRYHKSYYKKNSKNLINKSKIWAENNQDRIRDVYYKRTYGITLAQYNLLLKYQNNVCAICNRPPKNIRLNVDHCHRSKRVRGLLCFRCNKYLIGRFNKEHADIFRKAASYLESTFDGRNLNDNYIQKTNSTSR